MPRRGLSGHVRAQARHTNRFVREYTYFALKNVFEALHGPLPRLHTQLSWIEARGLFPGGVHGLCGTQDGGGINLGEA